MASAARGLARPWERWAGFWFEPVPPTNLGLCRLVFFAGVLLFYLGEDYSPWAAVSDVFRRPFSFFRVPGVPVLPGEQLLLLQTVWKVALGLSCIGLFTRLSTATSFVLGAYLIGLPHIFGMHHRDAMLVIILGIMALSRCGDSWSLDRLLRPAGSPASSGEYTWPIRLTWLVISLVFFGAGVSKLRHSGLEWIASENLGNFLIRAQYGANMGDPLTTVGLEIARHAWLYQSLAAATVALEVGYPLALVSRRVRLIAAPGGFALLVGFWALLGIAFVPLMICYLLWVPWDRVTRVCAKLTLGWAVVGSDRDAYHRAAAGGARRTP